MNVLGIIIVSVICLVLVIALFFEVKGLIKSIKTYRKRKQEKNQSQETKEDEETSN